MDAKGVPLKPSLVKNCCSQQFCFKWYNLSAYLIGIYLNIEMSFCAGLIGVQIGKFSGCEREI